MDFDSNIIEIDDFYFKILNKNIKIDDNRTIVNIYSSTNYHELIKPDLEINFNQVNKFAVYLSNSDLGCFRLCFRYNKRSDYEKGNDYIQSSFIHLKLQKFIHEILNNLNESEDYFCFEEMEYIKIVGEHIRTETREINKEPFITNSSLFKCGQENKEEYVDIIHELNIFSNNLKNLYNINFESNELISNIIINNDKNVYNLQFYKVLLTLKTKNDDYHHNIILYYCNAKITKFMEKIFNEAIYINIPVFLTTETHDKITKFGTFEKYILAGNYICKIFDYRNQCSSNNPNYCRDDYILIGDKYDNIFPLLEINESFNVDVNSEKLFWKITLDNLEKIKDIEKKEIEKKRGIERKMEKEIEEKVKEIKNKNLIKIDKFYFLIINKNITHTRPTVNIYSSTNENFNENNSKFSVYLSNSDLGCFRLCVKNNFNMLEKGNDYIQSSFIHIKLQEYIHQIFNNLKLSDDYFCSYIYKEDTQEYLNFIKISNHIKEKKRQIKQTPFIEYNQNACGEDFKQSSYHDVNNNLKKFSEILKSLYNYSKNKIISEVDFNDNNNMYYLKFYKVELQLIEENKDNLNNIILYYCNATITKFMRNEFEEPIYISLPVFLTTTNETITNFGTFNNYILAGNYICKVFDYIEQCAKNNNSKCYGNYKLIGDRYNDIFHY